MFGFEKLDVWQRAVEFADSVYQAMQRFPVDERFGLTNQMRRASISISSNVAEGSSRASRKDFGRFVEIAYGSLMETISQMHVAKVRSFVAEAMFEDLYGKAEQLARMLSGLKNRLRKQSQ
ncbi:MAG: four helix bundle protein [Planctomycetota bacterium]|jgi:four helix bundle protein